jgi:hypothetical protein
LNAKANPAYFGKILIAFIIAGYVPSGILFFIGGKKYKERMEELRRQEGRTSGNLAPGYA